MKDGRRSELSNVVVQLVWGCSLEPRYREQELDCRLLLLGDRYRQLVRAYEEVIYRLSHDGDVSDELSSSAEIQQYYDVSTSDGRVGLTLHDSAFKEQYHLNSKDFWLKVTAGDQLLNIPFSPEHLRVLGTLLPMLAGNHTETSIMAALEELLDPTEQVWARKLYATLDEQHLLERRARRPNSFLVSPTRPRVTFVGHTSLLLQTGEAMILTDPLLRVRLKSPERAFDVTRLELSAICCTHAHWDHCDVESLLRFNKKIPIVIPRVHQVTAFNPPIAPVLRSLGYNDVREYDPWERFNIGDIEMILIPFHGEQDEPGIKIDRYTYVYKMPNLTIYGGVDAHRDTFGDMFDVLKQVREEFHPSVAFLPISCMRYNYRTGGVNAFCRYVDKTLLDEEFQYTADPEEAAAWVEVLGVSAVVPYATFTFSPLATLNAVNEFDTALRRKGLADRLLPLRPLDSLDLSDLNGSTQAARRRSLLRQWHHVGARISKVDKLLLPYAPYRYARRFMSRARPGLHAHH